jgi:hypothetical protein
MRAMLGRAEDYRGTIMRFRAELGRKIGFAHQGADCEPLPFAFYLFVEASGANDAELCGMAELYFYDQAFDSYANCPHAEAFDLERLAPLDRVIHLRSLVVADGEHRSALLACLGQAVARLARRFGARYLTAEPLALEPDFLRACEAVGAPRTSHCSAQAREQALALVSLKPTADEDGARAIDALLLQTIRLRGRCALKSKQIRTGMRLDTLLPAHWVGVWQRQLHSFAM